MNTRVKARLIMALLLVLAVFMSFRVGLAQDGDEDTSDEPAGVGEIAQAADNFNVSVVPSQEEAKTVVNSPPAVSALEQAAANFDEEGMLRAMGVQIFSNKPIINVEDRSFIAKRKPPRQGDILVQITDDNGDVLTVFADYSVVAADAKGEVFFEGYIAGESVETLMIVGKNAQGTQFALSHDSVMGLTTSGDVFFWIDDHWYLYDYDEGGKFAGLFDSDGSEYQVESDDFGGVSITGPDGDAVQVDETGAFELYDEAGNLVVAGELFDETNDEFAGFDASTDYGDYGSDYGDAGGDYGDGDDSGGGDNSGDSDDSDSGDYAG